MVFPIYCSSQTDTIFKKDKSTLVCNITFVNNHSIFYNEKKDPGKFIELKLVSLYSQNGKRTDPSRPENKIMFPPQTIDTISAGMELDYMKSCFRRHSHEYYTGVITAVSGFALSVAGAGISGNNSDAGMVIAGIGGIVTLVGDIIMIDSHKWIRKAGLGINGKGNSVGIYYRFN